MQTILEIPSPCFFLAIKQTTSNLEKRKRNRGRVTPYAEGLHGQVDDFTTENSSKCEIPTQVR